MHFTGFRAISERIGVGDFAIGDFKLMIVVVYMAHCDYSDEDAESIYLELSSRV